MNVTDRIYFGDFGDILRGKVVEKPHPSSTVIFERDTSRPFLPGSYKLHKIKENVVIFCLETVDPMKIDKYLKTTDVGSDFKNKNYVNRYDWMSYKMFDRLGEGESDSEQTKDFKIKGKHILSQLKKIGHTKKTEECKLNYAEDIFCYCFITPNDTFYQNPNIEISYEGDLIYKAIDSDTQEILCFMADIILSYEWNYGILLQDENTGKYFAFIHQEEYTNITLDQPRDDIVKFTGFVKIDDFLY